MRCPAPGIRRAQVELGVTRGFKIAVIPCLGKEVMPEGLSCLLVVRKPGDIDFFVVR